MSTFPEMGAGSGEAIEQKPFPWEEMSDRNKLGPMLFPGSTVSHAYVKANPVQEFIMKNKFKGTGDYDPYNEAQRRAYIDYDKQTDVIARRYESMSWWSKITSWTETTAVSNAAMNTVLIMFFLRMYFRSQRSVLVGTSVFTGLLYYEKYI